MEKSPGKQSPKQKKKFPLDFGKLTLGSLRRYQVFNFCYFLAFSELKSFTVVNLIIGQIQAKWRPKGQR